MKNNWLTYIICCSDKSLYTGVTTDINRRLAEHNSGKGAKYTRSRRPVFLMALRDGMTRSQACKLEAAVKKAHKLDKVKTLASTRV